MKLCLLFVTFAKKVRMDFIEELKWRDMIQDITPGCEEYLRENKGTGYIGFDPTAPSLTIGNFVQIQLLTLFQRAGHKPIVLMGGATGRIGDPSFKKEERQLLSSVDIDRNLEFQKKQFEKFLDFNSKDNPAIIVNNYDFYKDMNILDFLRDVGKNLTVNYMLSKESVKQRLETGLSFTEFSYQLLQANDFLLLYNEHDCRVQMGGSDQWGNITSGTEFIRRNTEDGKAFAVTTPLLVKSDGTKFGKSEAGNIWLDPERTSPYQFYQFWINIPDDSVEQLWKYFTLKSKEETLSAFEEFKDNPRELKEMLAEEITCRIHSVEDYEIVKEISELLFSRNLDEARLRSMHQSTLESIKQELPSFSIPSSSINGESNITNLFTDLTGIMNSNGEVRRALSNNALSLNKNKLEDMNYVLSESDLLHGKYLFLENGRKNKYLVYIEN